MILTFLGTGTSQGVPVIGCDCKVCRSLDARDKRLRTSAMITTDDNKNILIDCGPDFRQQMLERELKNVDAVLITHEHNDHVIGLDDLRPIIFSTNKPINIYAKNRVLHEIKNRFPYAFSENKYPGAPSFELISIDDTFSLFGEKIIPINITHYQLYIYGFRFRNLAYITDASFISDKEKAKIKDLDILIINCLRKEKKHLSHFILPQILQLQEELKPRKIYLTHISHDFGLYVIENKLLPNGIELAYDGLEIFF